jgi:hypothetical protein
LRAIEYRDSQFFTPLWVEAGMRFTPNLLYADHEGYRIGVLTFPTPRDMTEAYMGAVVGRYDDPQFVRYFTWELSASLMTQERVTVIGEWDAHGRHMNHGGGPLPSGNLPTDVWQFVQAALRTLGLFQPLQ